jgi:hypothetical protein
MLAAEQHQLLSYTDSFSATTCDPLYIPGDFYIGVVGETGISTCPRDYNQTD